MIIKTLYARNVTGSTQTWSIDLDGDKYRTISGQLNSPNMVTTNWTYSESKNIGKKNETTADQQAEKEVAALIKKKIKEGYKEDVNDIDEESFYQVMLAKKVIDYKDDLKFPAIIDRKYNGSRILARKTALFTRKGEIYKSIPHIFETLQEVFKKYPNIKIDGEGYNHEYRYRLNEIMKLLRKSVHITEEDLELSRQKIKFYVYDAIDFEDVTVETPLYLRRKKIKEVLSNIPYIELVEGEIVNSYDELMNKYEEYVADGYEGAMYRDYNSPYENKRSRFLLKIKPEDSSEAVILDILEGEGNWASTGKVITLNWNGIIFNATFKGTYEQAYQFLTEKNNWIGKEVTFLYNGLTGLGVPNFARVDIDNCIKS